MTIKFLFIGATEAREKLAKYKMLKLNFHAHEIGIFSKDSEDGHVVREVRFQTITLHTHFLIPG